ncbi:endocuticle structural glycoprotein SgAbd-5-like [Hyposmocoma kahamanoa]|uniref:endocuticle structural glycoprotein SgAbd-5-like n=1 Tax=Hyposmocoma kahamanoa TaxID=1477025 RepID=UPI000E6DA552|nr:endocuticle structural glycoprotein SgAbd-5-like [Hyposmocoma kahamanoa]
MSLLVAAALSADSDKPKVEIITEATFVREDGYNFVYKTSDGVSREEEAQLITVGEHKGIGVRGSYSYLGPDGQEYQVTFTADDKGYNPQIRVIPKGSQ